MTPQWIVLPLVTLMALVLVSGGCVNVNANVSDIPAVKVDAPGVRVRTGGGSRDNDKPTVSKSQAYTIAKTVARRDGVRPEEYEIHDKEIGDVFWVIFERKRPRGGNDWRDHFTVRVAPDGAVDFYKTGLVSKPEGYEKIGGGEAEEIAKCIADREGARPWDYTINDKGVMDSIWVFFEHKNPRPDLDWKNYFAVRVSKAGLATFYAGN